MKKLFAYSTVLGIALSAAAVANAQAGPGNDDDRGSPGKKGAVLVLPKIELRWHDGADANSTVEDDELVQDTFISLSNDGNDDVSIHMFFVNGDTWAYFNDTALLTINQPAYWSAYSGEPGAGGAAQQPFRVVDSSLSGEPGIPLPADIDDGSGDRVLRGFIVLWATLDTEEPVCWNQLSAKVTIVNYANSDVAEYEAYAFQCLDDESATDPYGSDDEIELDGSSYDIAPALLLHDFYSDTHGFVVSGSGTNANDALSNQANNTSPNNYVRARTELTLLILDMTFLQGANVPRTKVEFITHNENENRRSFPGSCMTCWASKYLFNWSNSLGRRIMATDRGKSRIDGVYNAECDPAAGERIDNDARALLGVSTLRLSFYNTPPADASVAANGVATAMTTLVGESTDEGDNEAAFIQFGPLRSGGNIQGVRPASLNDE